MLLSDRVTTLPPAGAAWFSVTEHVVEDPEFTLVGLQESPETAVGATKLRLAVCDELFSVAVTVADWVVVSVPTVAVNVPELAFAATVTDAGTVK